MKKVIFLEGLPGVGKTTIINKLRTLKDINVVDEIINHNHETNRSVYFIKNDDLKINKYNEGLIVIDRGPLSTISYEQAKKVIDLSYDNDIAINWFNKMKKIYVDKNVFVIYLKKNSKEYWLPYENKMDPYGSKENQEILEAISLYNLKKYVRNYKIIDYSFDQMEDIIDEIIS